MIEKKSSVVQKKVRLIAVLGKTANEAAMLLTKILRSAGFIASFLNQHDNNWKDALKTAGKVCDFIILDASLLKEDAFEEFNLETVLVLCDVDKIDIKLFKGFKNIVLPYSLSEKLTSKEKNMLFYSMNNNEADLIAKNINPQEDRTVFELLGTGVIGRVKLSKSSGLSVELVLAVSSALVAMGVPLAAVLNVINQL